MATNEKKQENVKLLEDFCNDPDTFNESLAIMRDQLSDITFRPLPSVLDIGISNSSNIQVFADTDIHDLPEGIKCSKCFIEISKTTKDDLAQLCYACSQGNLTMSISGSRIDLVPLQVPPMTRTPVNYITIIARMSGNTNLPGDGYSFLHSFVELNRNLPFIETHLKVILTPCGSMANALSTLAVRRRKLSEKNGGIKFQSMANMVLQLIGLYKPNKDKVTFVASMMLSISCKPANLIRLLQDLKDVHIPPEDVNFLFVGKTTTGEVVNYEPWRLTGEELLNLLAKREKTSWLEDLNLSLLSRQYISGLNFRRNRFCGSQQLTEQQIAEIESRIQFIQSLSGCESDEE